MAPVEYAVQSTRIVTMTNPAADKILSLPVLRDLTSWLLRMIPQVPIDNLLDVWWELETAHEGQNGFSGHVAEIYAYRLLPSGPRYPITSPITSPGSCAGSRISAPRP
jgi:hypothetical protein